MMSHLVDSHVHVWEPDAILYPPLPALGELPSPGPTVEMLLQEMERHGVERAVLVQPSNYEFDNRYLVDALRRFPDRFAGVARIDVMDASAPQRLALWTERGIGGLRVVPFRIFDGAWVNDPRIAPLWERAVELSTVVCFQISGGRLGALCQLLEPLAARYPALTIALDHMGHFEVERGVDDPAFQAMLALARYERLYVKISGHYAISQEPYPHRDTWPFMQAIYERFGAQRMMWGSDFPYIVNNGGYSPALALIREHLPFFDDTDREWILGRTASTLFFKDL